VWAPVGERPIAHGHHRFDWLYVTAFVSPATGETFWYLSNGVSKEFFEALLETFAREAEAGLSRIILLVLDNAGWHGPANLKIPDGIRLIHLPPYSPELQPPKLFGRLSTSRSSTSTLQLSRNSTRKSPTNASPLPSSQNKSNHAPISIGGQIRSSRINQPETV
jgi:DDE superfamily endonuclease